jgi:hypothetical protein
VGFDAAEFRVGRVEHDGVDAELGEEFGEVGAGFGDEFIGEEIAIAEEDAEGEGLLGFHGRKREE